MMMQPAQHACHACCLSRARDAALGNMRDTCVVRAASSPRCPVARSVYKKVPLFALYYAEIFVTLWHSCD